MFLEKPTFLIKHRIIFYKNMTKKYLVVIYNIVFDFIALSFSHFNRLFNFKFLMDSDLDIKSQCTIQPSVIKGQLPFISLQLI